MGKFEEVGVGTLWYPNNIPISTADFGSSASIYTGMIYDGSHVWTDVTDETKYQYMTVIYVPGGTVKSVSVIVNGVPQPLTLGFGNETRGEGNFFIIFPISYLI